MLLLRGICSTSRGQPASLMWMYIMETLSRWNILFQRPVGSFLFRLSPMNAQFVGKPVVLARSCNKNGSKNLLQYIPSDLCPPLLSFMPKWRGFPQIGVTTRNFMEPIAGSCRQRAPYPTAKLGKNAIQ